MKAVALTVMLVLLASACGGSLDTAPPATTAVQTTSAAPTTTTAPAATTTRAAAATTAAAPTAIGAPATTAVGPVELAAACLFDDSVPKISCSATGVTQGYQLRWESNVAGWLGGPTYEFTLIESHQLVPEVLVTLQECQGSDCVTVETRIDTSVLVPSSSAGSTQATSDSHMAAQPSGGDCPEDFAGWFTTFPLEDHTLVYEVGPPGRIDPDDHRGHGYFRIPTGMNAVNVRMPVDATLYMGSNHYEDATKAVSDKRVIQYRLEFKTKCDGIRFRFDHIAEPVPKIVDLFTREPLVDGSYGMQLEPLFLREGELIGTKIGIETNGNAFVDFGVYDDFRRVRTAQDPRFENATCFYEFFSPSMAKYLSSRILRVDSLEEGLCPSSSPATNQPPTSTNLPSSASELAALCTFDEPARRLSCQASGHSDSPLTWTTSLDSSFKTGPTYEKSLDWGQYVQQISVQLEECKGSACSTTTTTLEVQLLARGDCPEDFTGWFNSFVLDSVNLVTEVGPPARIIGSDYEAGGYFRVTQGQNDLDVRIPIDSTLTSGNRHLASSAPGVFEVQYGLNFRTGCEGLRFAIGHLADPVNEISSLFTTEPTEDSSDIDLPPLEFESGDLLATAIGFRADGNAFVGFGVYDDFLRVPTAQTPSFYNAACYYNFFSLDISSDLLYKTTYHEPSEEGVCP